MASATDFFENKVIDHNLRGQAYTVPTTIYLALFTSATTDAGGGTEVTGGSYARQAITLSAAVGGNTSNANVMTFTALPSCTVTNWAIFDDSTGGNMLIHDTVSAAKAYAAGESATVAGGELDITVF